MFFLYFIHNCFICRPSDSTVPEDARIEPRTVATWVLDVRRCNHSTRSHPENSINEKLRLDQSSGFWFSLLILSFAAYCGGGGGQPRAVPAGAGARAHHRGGGGSARHGAVPRPRCVFPVGDSLNININFIGILSLVQP